MDDLPPHFRVAAAAVQKAEASGAALIAIDGRKMVGKTSLGRFLSYSFGTPLISGDLFLDHSAQPNLAHHYDDLKRIFDKRFTSKVRQATIIESITVLRILEEIGHYADFHIYIYNDAEEDHHGLYASDIADYEAKYEPIKSADLRLENPLPIETEMP